MPDIQSYPEAVGSFLRAYREENRLTLEAVARAGHEYGARWGVASIRNIEVGKAALTVPTVIMLALSLRKLTGKSLTLSDMTGEASSISLGAEEALPVTRAWLAEVLSGGTVELRARDRSHTGRQLKDAAEHKEVMSFAQSDEAQARGLTQINESAVVAGFWEASLEPPEPPEDPIDDQPASLAEKRAAKALQIDPQELKSSAMALYGQSLEAESIERVGKDATPQKRGSATRAIIEEIRAERENGV